MIYGEIENCYNIEDVTGTKNIGGILGAADNNIESYISNCYSSGKISGEENTGNIVGDIDRGYRITEIINCYMSEDTFTAEDLGEAFKDDEENINNGYPILNWESD